jgi:hypothetical protein
MQSINLENIDYKNIKTISSKKKNFIIIYNDNTKQKIDSSLFENQSNLKAFFNFWIQSNPNTALKAIYDYTNPDRKIYHFLFWSSFILFGLFFIIFFSEGYKTYSCNRLLQNPNNLVFEKVKILKETKNRRGIITWTFNLQEKTIKRQTSFSNQSPHESYAPIVYPKDHPECTDISLNFNEPQIPWRQRLFITQLNLSLSFVFFLIGSLISIYLYIKSKKKNLYEDYIKNLYLELTYDKTKNQSKTTSLI